MIIIIFVYDILTKLFSYMICTVIRSLPLAAFNKERLESLSLVIVNGE